MTTTATAATLTEMETRVLLASQETEFTKAADDGSDTPWNWAVQERSGISAKQYRGVVSSLVQKGMATILDYGRKNRSEDMVFSLTEVGRAYYSALTLKQIQVDNNPSEVEIWDQRTGFAKG